VARTGAGHILYFPLHIFQQGKTRRFSARTRRQLGDRL
jgi:hypothetical protein